MSVDRSELLNKLVSARIDLASYLRLRKAKGYMSVSESNRLHQSLFALCNELRDSAACLQEQAKDRDVFNHAAGILSSAALCLMSGRHDCPTFIAVNAEKLADCLTSLTLCIQCLEAHKPVAGG